MKDMRASGFEPINIISRYKWQDGLGYYESTKDASTNFFIDYLTKVGYVFEYDLRVNNAGDFSNGITTIQSMYAPEFSSYSEGMHTLTYGSEDLLENNHTGTQLTVKVDDSPPVTALEIGEPRYRNNPMNIAFSSIKGLFPKINFPSI